MDATPVSACEHFYFAHLVILTHLRRLSFVLLDKLHHNSSFIIHLQPSVVDARLICEELKASA